MAARAPYLGLNTSFVVHAELNDGDDEGPKEANDEENKNTTDLLDSKWLGLFTAVLGTGTRLRYIEFSPPLSLQLVQCLRLL